MRTLLCLVTYAIVGLGISILAVIVVLKKSPTARAGIFLAISLFGMLFLLSSLLRWIFFSGKGKEQNKEEDTKGFFVVDLEVFERKEVH